MAHRWLADSMQAIDQRQAVRFGAPDGIGADQVFGVITERAGGSWLTADVDNTIKQDDRRAAAAARLRAKLKRKLTADQKMQRRQ